MRSRCSWKRENETDFSDCESFPINYSLLLILSIHKDEYFSRRLADRQLFRMVAVAYDKSLPIIERREKFQFGVVTLDLDSVTLGSAGSLALEAQKLLPRICIVGTKLNSSHKTTLRNIYSLAVSKAITLILCGCHISPSVLLLALALPKFVILLVC